jgi:hypothetical protein
MLGVVLAFAVATVAFSAWKPGSSPAVVPQLESASKHLRLSQPNEGEALITLPNAKPGQRASGSTRLTVVGASAKVSVRAIHLRDVVGPNGGRLIASKQLWIDVRCATRPCGQAAFVYSGPLSQMGTQSLGTWPAGGQGPYRIRVWLPRGPSPTNATGNNLFQGSQAKFGLIWTATAA